MKITYFRKPLLIILSLLAFTAISLSLFVWQPSTGYALTDAEFEQKARDSCGTDPVPSGDSACRHGFRWAADARADLATTCTNRDDYSPTQRARCTTGFGQGESLRASISAGSSAARTDCNPSNFLSFPTWYKYLKLNAPPECNPVITGLNDFWLIGLAVIEILLRIAILVAVVYVLIGGIKYITSRGNSEKVDQGRTTVIDALIGLVIAIIATASISYIAGRFSA